MSGEPTLGQAGIDIVPAVDPRALRQVRRTMQQGLDGIEIAGQRGARAGPAPLPSLAAFGRQAGQLATRAQANAQAGSAAGFAGGLAGFGPLPGGGAAGARAATALQRQREEALAAQRRSQQSQQGREGQPSRRRPAPGGPGPDRPGSLPTSAQGLNKISTALGQISTRVGLASFQIQMMGNMLTQSVTMPAVGVFQKLSQTGLEFAVNVDYARASLKALLKPTDDIEGILNRIKQVAIDSPLFAADDAIQYAQQLAAIGVKGRDLVPTMQSMSNVFLTQGVAGPHRAKLAMLAYTQILSKGAIGMDDLRQQFAEHVPGGIKIFEAVARSLGYKSLEQLRDAFKSGKVSAEQLNAAFIKFGQSKKYVDGAANAGQSLGGVWQSFTEEITTRVGTAFDENRAQIIAAIDGIRPVVMAFIDWFVAKIPEVLRALNNLIKHIQVWREKYDRLNTSQQDTIKFVTALAIAAGPAAMAIGILGTALSTVTNLLSLFFKTASLAASGIGLGAIGPVGWAVAAALVAVGAAFGLIYKYSEGFQDKFLQVANVIKDIYAAVILPLVDRIYDSFQKLASLIADLGFEVEDLAYVFYGVVVGIAAFAIALTVVMAALEAVKAVTVIVVGALDGLTEAIAGVLWITEQAANIMGKLPGDIGAPWRAASKGIGSFRDTLRELINTGEVYNKLDSESTSVTDGFRRSLEDTDLTVTGLVGILDLFGIGLRGVTEEEIALEQAVTNARRAMDAQGNAAASATTANDNYNKAKLALTESVKRNSRTLAWDTQAGQDNRDAMKRAAAASYEMMMQDLAADKPAHEAIARHKARTDALTKEFGKSKEVQAEAAKLIATYGAVPRDVRTLLEIMGYKDVDAKMMDILIKQHMLARPKSVNYSYATAKAALQKQTDVKAAQGGLMRGPGGPTGDRIRAMLSDGEYVVRAAAVQRLGVGILDHLNRFGSLPPMYAAGGLVTWPMAVDISGTEIPAAIGGDLSGGGIGSAKMMAILQAQFPGLPLLSGDRPGDITSTGNRSYHAMGRAVDVPPMWSVFNWIRENYGRATRELIFTPAGGMQIWNGRDHLFTGGTIAQDHYDHVHWAYDNGGYIPPNTPFINKTGSAELALNAAQASALEDRIRNSDQPMHVSVYVDGVRRDAEIVWDKKADELVRALGGY